MMWEYAVPILTLTLLVLSGQVLFGSFGILLSGQPLKIAIQSGFSLTQVGEFAFIIASLGVSLNAVSYTHLDVYKRQYPLQPLSVVHLYP